MDKYGFKLTVESRQGVTSGTETAESLSSFVAESLGFIPARGKGLVAVRIVELMSRIAGKRDTTIKTKNGRVLNVKNGAIRVEDLHKWLKDEGADIGMAQLYNTYVTNLVRSRLVSKKKYSMYGLRGNSLEDALVESRRDLDKEFSRVVDHARALDNVVRKG